MTPLQEPHSPDSERVWNLLVARIEHIEQAVDRAANRDDDAWAEYRRKCDADDNAKARLLADTAAMVERLRVATTATIEAGHQRLTQSIDKRFKAVWAELRGRPGATRPPFWARMDARAWAVCMLIALALLAVIFNAQNLGELCGTLLARMAGQ